MGSDFVLTSKSWLATKTCKVRVLNNIRDNIRPNEFFHVAVRDLVVFVNDPGIIVERIVVTEEKIRDRTSLGPIPVWQGKILVLTELARCIQRTAIMRMASVVVFVKRAKKRCQVRNITCIQVDSVECVIRVADVSFASQI